MTPVDLAWREVAEGEVTGDLERADRALAYLARLEQRRSDDAVEDGAAQGQRH